MTMTFHQMRPLRENFENTIKLQQAEADRLRREVLHSEEERSDLQRELAEIIAVCDEAIATEWT